MMDKNRCFMMDKTPFLLIITPLSIIVSIIKTEMYSDKLGRIRTGEGFKYLIKKKISDILGRAETWNWLRGLDLNQRPSGYEPDELPDCSTPRSSRRTALYSFQDKYVKFLSENFHFVRFFVFALPLSTIEFVQECV